ELTAGRLRLVRELKNLVASSYSAVSGTERDTDLRYRMSAHSRADTEVPPEPEPDIEKLAGTLRDALALRRRAELDRAVGRVGPRGEELEWEMGGLPARGYASHGESWSLALALRLAGYQLLRAGGDDPVLMLDDVFAELDSARRE